MGSQKRLELESANKT
jgi:hypothetical protein